MSDQVRPNTPGAEDTDANPSIEESETYYAERRDGGDSDPENKADIENPALVDKDEAGTSAPGSASLHLLGLSQ